MPDTYHMGITTKEIKDVLEQDSLAKDVDVDEMDVLLDHIRFEFDWSSVYQQIKDIAGEWIADKDSHMGRD